MDRSFPESEEVSCFCFDFTRNKTSGLKPARSSSLIHQPQSKSKTDTGKVSVIQSSNVSRKSLKRKSSDTSLIVKSSHDTKSIKNNNIPETRHNSTNTDFAPLVKQQKWIVFVSTPKQQSYLDINKRQSNSKLLTKKPIIKLKGQDLYNSINITKINDQASSDRFESILKVVQQANKNIQKLASYKMTNGSEKNYDNYIVKQQLKSRKSNFANAFADISIISNSNNQQTSTIKVISEKEFQCPQPQKMKKRIQKDINNFKKISIRAQNNHIFIKQLQKIRELHQLKEIYPKESQSIDEQVTSQNQSQVVEKWKSTWNSENSKMVSSSGHQIISSLHIQDEGKTLKRRFMKPMHC